MTGTGCNGRLPSRLPGWPFGACTNVARFRQNDLFPICLTVSTDLIIYILYTYMTYIYRSYVSDI